MAVIQVLDDTIYNCNPNFVTIRLGLQVIMQLNADYEEAHKNIGEEGVECLPDDTDYHNLITQVLLYMGLISLLYPMNRAIYPIPNLAGVIIET